jgi:hypothetical protein
MLGLTALEFRRRFPFPAALKRFVELMVTPYLPIWRTFHPVAAGGWDGARPQSAAKSSVFLENRA